MSGNKTRFEQYKEFVAALSETDRRDALRTTQGQIYLLVQAVEQQTRRLRDSESATTVDHQADAVLFIFALRSLLQVVTSSQMLVPEGERAKIEAAIETFAEAAPSAKDARDVLAHLDEYIVGFGRLQEAGDRAWVPWYSRTGSEYTVMVGNMAISVEAAADAALEIAMAVLLVGRG